MTNKTLFYLGDDKISTYEHLTKNKTINIFYNLFNFR